MSTTGQAQAAPLLEMRGISKSFLGVWVLARVDVELHPGEVHAIVGENGAGKSTLMKVLAGVHQPDEGEIRIGGTQVGFRHPAESQAAGIAVIHQEFNLLPDRTVAENVFLGREPLRRGLVDRTAMDRRTQELIAGLAEVSFGPRTLIRRLSVAQQQVVEIVKALSLDARVLVMDEPTAALADHEVERLYALVRRLARRGLGVLYISHRLREVFDLAYRVTVLKDGARVHTAPTAELDTERLVGLMVGRDLGAYYPPVAKRHEIGEPVLTVSGGAGARLHDIDLTLRAGEIVGVGGLQGSGRSALGRAIFGADPFTTGRLTLAGRPVRISSPRGAIRCGIGLLSEDRKAEGLALRQSVRDNVLMVVRAAFPGVAHRGSRRRLPVSAEELAALFTQVRLAARSPDQEVRFLSGGNQQKVAIAKWLAVRPRVLVVDEPTRGVDVGAKAAIHELLRALAREGIAMLAITSELPELLGMSDRIIVMRDGRIAGELPGDTNEDAVMRLATGAANDGEGTAT